jgi:hypothetical protein
VVGVLERMRAIPLNRRVRPCFFVEVNDPHSLWPRATRARLWSVDPRMAAIVASLFEFDLVA